MPAFNVVGCTRAIIVVVVPVAWYSRYKNCSLHIVDKKPLVIPRVKTGDDGIPQVTFVLANRGMLESSHTIGGANYGQVRQKFPRQQSVHLAVTMYVYVYGNELKSVPGVSLSA